MNDIADRARLDAGGKVLAAAFDARRALPLIAFIVTSIAGVNVAAAGIANTLPDLSRGLIEMIVELLLAVLAIIMLTVRRLTIQTAHAHHHPRPFSSESAQTTRPVLPHGRIPYRMAETRKRMLA